MRKNKKPFWQKFLIALVAFVLFAVVSFGIGCASIYVKHDVNVFKIGGQVKKLNKEVDLSKILTNPFSEQDLADAKLISDEKLSGLISYSEQDGYSVEFEQIESNLMGDLKLTDRQMGAIIESLIRDAALAETESESDTGVEGYEFQIKQVSFSNITETSADVNVVMELDLAIIKEGMNTFPFSLVSKYIPETLYLSSTVTVVKGENVFEYSTVGKSITFNNLTEKETEHLINALDIVVKFGEATDLANSVAGSVVNLMIGNEKNEGIAYSLKEVGATGFHFETDGVNNYLVIEA